ncbi:MAG: FHA domain-containing protein [Solirubrobacteraceae bacterium]
MRASDQARERTAALLRRRCQEGYLSLDTFERRVEDVYRARSTEQLAGLTADLPAIGVAARLRQWRVGHRSHARAAASEGLRVPLDLVRERPLVLGRGQHCDVVLNHDTVSRTHAEIRRHGDGWCVRDLSSSNGTWIDGRHVGRAESVRRGDQILLGGCPVLLL